MRDGPDVDTTHLQPSTVPPELALFDVLPEVVVAIDAALTICYANPFAHELTGYDETILGKSIIDLVHPDDLQRASEVVELIMDGTLGADVTPANYRLHCADESWLTIEVTATPPVRFMTGEERIVIMGHYSGDTNLRNQVFDMLTAGRSIPDVIEVLPCFGTWRYPRAHYAIAYPADDGSWHSVGSSLAAELLERFDGPDTPWAQARAGVATLHGWNDLDPDLQHTASRLGLHGCMVVPVPILGSSDIAVAVAWSTDPHQSVSAHRYALEQMAATLDVVLQWRSHLRDLEHAARFDALSGLVNRNAFIEAFERTLGQANASGESVAVLYVDLDDFKGVNDFYGHAVGDAVITETAQRMRAIVGPHDLVGRIGGDEFAILCPGVLEREDVTALADRIIATLGEPFTQEGYELRLGASVGVTITAAHMSDHTSLLAAADRALYQAKADGRGRWRLA